MNPIYGAGIDVIEAIQSALAPQMDLFFKVVAFFGDIEFYIFAVAIIYWAWGKRRGVTLFLLLMGQGVVVSGVKVAAVQPRPYWFGEVEGIGTRTSYGLPSGHAAGSLTFFGWLALEVRRWWMWTIAAIAVILIAFSRLYLGVHFPQDLLAGWAIALVALAVVPRLVDRYWDKWKGASPGFLVATGLLGAAASIATWACAWAIASLQANDPAWARFAHGARSPESFIVFAAAFFGASCGWIAARHWTSERLGGPWWRRLLGLAGGCVIVAVVVVVFEFAKPADEGMVRHVVSFVQMGLASATIIAGVPWLHRRFGLEAPFTDAKYPETTGCR